MLLEINPCLSLSLLKSVESLGNDDFFWKSVES